ncbi:MAG TPA: 50S ribosomal protein L25/general stress protein Ctc [Bacillota bacterium]|nr:50S ribosomal protein L25/general stress protein Ctc [Bacillota bacterium]
MAVELKAALRENHAGSATKKIRKEGKVPGVVYGKGKESKSIAIDGLDLMKKLREAGRNAIIRLEIESDSPVDVMLHEYQMDPIKNDLLHVDFYVVDMEEELDVEVQLRLVGEPVGTKEGGVLQQPLYELLVRAKPNQIPEQITIDVSELEIGDAINISDLKKSEEYTIIEDDDTTVATVLAPDTLDDLTEEDPADEMAEPELVGAEEEDEDEEDEA